VDTRYSPFLGHPPSVLEFTPGAGFFVSLPGVLFPGKPHLSDNRIDFKDFALLADNWLENKL